MVVYKNCQKNKTLRNLVIEFYLRYSFRSVLWGYFFELHVLLPVIELYEPVVYEKNVYRIYIWLSDLMEIQ